MYGRYFTPTVKAFTQRLRNTRTTLSISARWSTTSTKSEDVKPHTTDFSNSEIKRVNEEYKNKLIIQKNGAVGYGLVATRAFSKGDHVMTGKAKSSGRVQHSHTLQTSAYTHTLMGLPCVLVNHSCDANLGIQDNAYGAYDYFAVKPIAQGDELLWDYETSEYEINDFPCACGASGCRGRLRGYKHHGEIVKRIYGDEYIAGYLSNSSSSSAASSDEES